MSDVYSVFADSLGDVRNAPTPRDLWNSLKRFAQPFGYSYMAGADAERAAEGAAAAIFYSDGPANAVLRQIRAFTSLPFIARGLASPEPFLISTLRSDPTADGAWIELLADVVQRGEGLALPVHERGRAAAGFMFGGDKPDVSGTTTAMLHILAYAAFERYRALLNAEIPAPPYGLSIREVQCLRSAATGRSDVDVGIHLGISARTVRFHLDSAKAKFGVKSRIQAIAKALQEKIITV